METHTYFIKSVNKDGSLSHAYVHKTMRCKTEAEAKAIIDRMMSYPANKGRSWRIIPIPTC